VGDDAFLAVAQHDVQQVCMVQKRAQGLSWWLRW
jgi:hypothetical protein